MFNSNLLNLPAETRIKLLKWSGLISNTSALIGMGAAFYIIRIQDKRIKALSNHCNNLIDALKVFNDYVPPDVAEPIAEKLAFDGLVYNNFGRFGKT